MMTPPEADLYAELAAVRYRLSRLERHPRRSRLFATFSLALLVALVPLSLFAAGFTDLNTGSPHNENINAIAAVGITKGCNPPDFTNYCPNEVVTREQMASFLARTAGLGSNPPVANAKTAQTTNKLATNPASDTAFAANDLARVAGTHAGSVPLNSGNLVTGATVTVTVPTQGYVLVIATGVLANTGPNCPCTVTMRLHDTVAAIQGDGTAVQVLRPGAANNAQIENVALTAVFAATPGQHTYAVELQRLNGTETVLAVSDITALFVPFGANGEPEDVP